VRQNCERLKECPTSQNRKRNKLNQTISRHERVNEHTIETRGFSLGIGLDVFIGNTSGRARYNVADKLSIPPSHLIISQIQNNESEKGRQKRNYTNCKIGNRNTYQKGITIN
jgi:hypothetical protein